MKDDELDVWRRQWLAQSAVPDELIRKVEHETVRLRRAHWAFLAPAAVAASTTLIVVFNPRLDSIVLAAGMWVLVALSWWAYAQNMKDMWAPASETTAAYLDLSIERCRRALRHFRYGDMISPLITAFVLAGVIEGMKSQGRLESAADIGVAITTSLFTIGVVAFVMFVNNRQRKKTQTELAHLLDLQRQLKEGGR